MLFPLAIYLFVDSNFIEKTNHLPLNHVFIFFTTFFCYYYKKYSYLTNLTNIPY